MRQPVWFACGDTGLLLIFRDMVPDLAKWRFPQQTEPVNPQTRQLGQMMHKKADSGAFGGLTDIVPGLCSVLFHYDPVMITAAELKQMSLHLEQRIYPSRPPHVYGDCRFAMTRNLLQTSRMWSAKQT